MLLLRRVTILGLCACVWLAGCSDRSSRSSPTYTDAEPPPEEPWVMSGEVGRYGGRFVVIGTSTPHTFNAFINRTIASGEVIGRMFVRLTRLDGSSQEDVPALAKDWTVSDDRLTWTFHLRKGARFSDGHPLTAEDVRFSFDAALDPRVNSPFRAEFSTDGTPWQMATPDPYTVVVKTPSPVAAVPMIVGGLSIVPKHILEPSLRDGTFASTYGLTTPPDQLITSGPWLLKSFRANERTVLARNPHWFGVDTNGQRLPYLDELVFLSVPDQNAADLKFRVGEVDALPAPLPENHAWYRDHQQEGNFTLHEVGPRIGPTFLFFNLNRIRGEAAGEAAGAPHVGRIKHAWFSHRVFRRAVSKAIDREAVITSVFHGDAVKSWGSATPGDKRWHIPDLVHDDYDPEGARQMLASLGWKDQNGDGILEDHAGNPVRFTVKVPSDNLLRVAMANFIRDDLTRMGLGVSVQTVASNTLAANVSNDFQYDAAIGAPGFARPNPASHAALWRSDSASHYWNSRQPTPETPEEARVDALMQVIQSTIDAGEQKVAWRELQTIANEQAWLVWLPAQVMRMPVRNRFGNVQPTSALPGTHSLLWNSDQIYVKDAR